MAFDILYALRNIFVLGQGAYFLRPLDINVKDKIDRVRLNSRGDTCEPAHQDIII